MPEGVFRKFSLLTPLHAIIEQATGAPPVCMMWCDSTPVTKLGIKLSAIQSETKPKNSLYSIQVSIEVERTQNIHRAQGTHRTRVYDTSPPLKVLFEEGCDESEDYFKDMMLVELDCNGNDLHPDQVTVILSHRLAYIPETHHFWLAAGGTDPASVGGTVSKILAHTQSFWPANLK